MTDIDIGYNLDASGYLAGAGAIEQANMRMNAAMAGTAGLANGLTRAMSMMTPGKATIAGMGLFAQQAAQAQQSLSGLAATSTVTGANVNKLAVGIRSMAREMPLGANGSRALVEQFTKMGVAGAGSEQKILKLAKATAQLSGATGEGPAALAAGMAELSRATGNVNLDPKRYQAMGDALTTISAKSGASATSILSFGKAIAPMASASGIGSAGILGISSAFAKLGEDGIVAQNTVTKMLGDMNKAVRDGGPEMKTYARLAGQSADEFERLFKSDPAEALTRITENIAKAGPGAPRMLEQIGIEGVRGVRSLQAVTAAGGLRPGIREATAAYGSGSTEKAAEAAFGGLNDSLTQLHAASEQLAEAFGTPLLKPLTTFADMLTAITGKAGEVAGSGIAQKAMGAATWVGLSAMVAKAVLGPMTTLLMGRQALTSGPLVSGMGAYAAGRGLDPATSRMARMGQTAATRHAAGTLGQGFLGGTRMAVWDRLYGMGQGVTSVQGPPTPRGGPGPIRMTAETMRAYGVGGATAALSMSAQQIHNASIPWYRRTPSWGMPPAVSGAGTAGADAYRAARASGMSIPAASMVALGGFNTELKDATKGVKGLKGASVATGDAMFKTAKGLTVLPTDATKAVAQAGGGGVRGFGRAIGGVAMSMGPMIAMTAAIAGVTKGVSNLNAEKDKTAARQQADISGTINAYRDSIGKAVDATQTFGSVTEQMNKNLGAKAKLGTFEDVRKVTDEDIAGSLGSIKNVVNKYSGTAEEMAAQVQSFKPGGVTTDELQAIKLDLGRQMDRSTVQQVMNLLPKSFEAGPEGGLGRDQFAPVLGMVGGEAGEQRKGGWSTFQRGLVNAGTGELDKLDAASRQPGWQRAISMAPGGGWHSSSLTEAATAQIKGGTEGIAQQYGEQSSKFGDPYAQQERGKAANEFLKQIYETGNADAFLEASKALGADLGGPELKDKIWSPEEFKKKGFDFTAMVAGESDAYRGAREASEKAGGRMTGEGGIEAKLIEQSYTKDIGKRSKLLGDVFDATSKSPAAQAMSLSLAKPDDAKKSVAAQDAVIAGADKVNKSMVDLAIEASSAAQTVDQASDAFAALKKVQARAEFEMHDRAVTTGMTASDEQLQQYKYQTALAEQVPTTPEEADSQQRAKEAASAIREQMRARMVARLQMQRQADIAEGRARQDFERQQLYSKKDYELQVFRLERNANLQVARSRQDFRRSQERAETDYALSRFRQIRDFNTSVLRAEKDFQTQKARQQRDFDIALKRQIEDAAKSMYDPYDRIQTKATWDTANLIANMAEQTEAIAKQKEQLDELRKMGLSAQTIDVLGLGKTENAQQLNNIMADATPESIAALNAAAKAKAAAAGELYTDDSNVELKRQSEDFARSMKDQEIDFKKSMKRQREDLKKTLADSAHDFHTSMTRARTDFKIQLGRTRADLQTTLSDMALDRDTAMTRAKKALDVQLGRMADDIKEADLLISGNMEELAEATNAAVHGKAVKWQGLMKKDTETWVGKMKTDVIPKVKAAYEGMGISVADVASGSTAVTAQPGYTGSEHSNRAEGGPINGFSPHTKADNVKVNATAGEFMQPVKAVQHYGPSFMEAVRTLRFPRDMAMNLAEGGMVYKQMTNWLNKNIPGAKVTSDYRPGAITALGNVSMHGLGKAIDITPSMSTFNKILSTFGKKIHQLFYAPADGRTILKGNPWKMDPTTKSGHWDHVHWAMQSMEGLANALGVDPAALKAIFAKGPRKLPFQRPMTDRAMNAVIRKLSSMGVSSDGSAGGGAYQGSEDVARWSDETRSVLRWLGRPSSEEGAVLRRIQMESGGNPRAINNWDSNARRGTPSKGLMQVIDPTFDIYRNKGLRDDIYDPMANIYAGSNYAVKRYGSLAAIDPKVKPTGYDEGGWMKPGEGKYANATRKPEAVLNARQWADISKLAHKVAQMVSADDVRGINAAKGAHIVVNNNQHYAYDQRNDFSGAEITVRSEDPDAMARKLQAKVTQARLTQTRGVPR